jgi:1,4-alpha-glucan branching enzyme
MTHAVEPALGARAQAGGVRFTVWSDKAREVSVVLYDRPTFALGQAGQFGST